jgi:hypothetical protein
MRKQQRKAIVTFRRAPEADSGEAFVHDFRRGFRPIADGDVEACGEEFIAAVTSNDAVAELARDEPLTEEIAALGFEMHVDDLLDDSDLF